MTIGWVTLDVGEQALVYALRGEARIEVGPCRLFLFREKLLRLDSSAANQSEYLVIKYKDGRVLHKQGPCVMYKNPMEHKEIEVKKGISLDANEVLVIYQQDMKTKEVTRYLHQGPTLYIPSANEWLHEFKWHGTDPENKTRMIPGSHTFTKLKVIPDQFYYNYETEEQKQNMTDMNLKNDLERITLEQSMEMVNLKHKHTIQSSEQAHKLTLKAREQEERVKRYKKEEEGRLLAKKAKTENTLKHYQQLHDLDVDMTQFVLSENPHPNKIIRIVGGEQAANLHLHQN